jgi:hypothetical protein
MCKIFLTTFKGSIRVWYNNLKSSSITNFGDLYTKLVTQFSISIPAKKASRNSLGLLDKSTLAYLKRFNEEMFKVKELIKLVAFKALISGVKKRALWILKKVESETGH